MRRERSAPIAAIITAAAFASSCLPALASASDLISGRASEGLVFVAADDGGMDLWRARISDGALQRIGSTPDQEERWPVWSEATKRVAYLARNTSGFMKSNVMLMDVSKGEEEALGPEPDLFQYSPVWSPDGKSLAHTYRVPATQPRPASPSGAVIVEPGSENRIVIATHEQTRQDLDRLEFSSDGKMILANGRDGSREGADKLWILQPNKRPRELRSIPSGIYSRPHFTRDNKQVIFTHRALRAKRGVMILDLAPNSRARRIARFPGSEDHSAIPSPTRDEIVFISDRDGAPDLFLFALSGGKPVNLTKSSEAAEIAPAWSPDGERIAYVVVPQEKFQAKEKDHASNKVRVIDRTGKILFETAGVMPSWMPPWTGDIPLSPGVSDPTKDTAIAETTGESP